MPLAVAGFVAVDRAGSGAEPRTLIRQSNPGYKRQTEAQVTFCPHLGFNAGFRPCGERAGVCNRLCVQSPVASNGRALHFSLIQQGVQGAQDVLGTLAKLCSQILFADHDGSVGKTLAHGLRVMRDSVGDCPEFFLLGLLNPLFLRGFGFGESKRDCRDADGGRCDGDNPPAVAEKLHGVLNEFHRLLGEYPSAGAEEKITDGQGVNPARFHRPLVPDDVVLETNFLNLTPTT